MVTARVPITQHPLAFYLGQQFTLYSSVDGRTYDVVGFKTGEPETIDAGNTLSMDVVFAVPDSVCGGAQFSVDAYGQKSNWTTQNSC